jgi:argininosuccinate synthase
MARLIFAFNGDLESCLALHWLVHEQGYEVITLSLNLGQEEQLQQVGELALELGAVAAQVLDCREMFLREFVLPLIHANAVYQSNCFLGSALARYVIAQELVRAAHEEGCRMVGHSATTKGNDQVRMETAIAAQDPDLKVIAPVRLWNLRTLEDKVRYAQRHRVPIQPPENQTVRVDRNLWSVNLYLYDLKDTWEEPPTNVFVLTRSPDQTPNESATVIIGFEQGMPVSLDGQDMGLVPLVRRLNQLGGEHGVGRSDVVEDRLFGIKSREFYEAPASTLLILAHRELESLVQGRELRQMKDQLSQRYAELAYTGLWFHELRRSLDGFFQKTQQYVTGEVRLRLFKGLAAILGRRSPHSLYDSQLAGQSNLDMFDNLWAHGFTSLWSLASRMAARQHADASANE